MDGVGRLIRKGYDAFERWRSYANIRKKAHGLREEIVAKKGYQFLDQHLTKEIKEYAKSRFGSSRYWPWLALYAEVREDFKEGWIPEEYYRLELIKKLNPKPLSLVSTAKSFDHRIFKGFAVEPTAVKISGCFYNTNQEKMKAVELLEIIKSSGKEFILKMDEGPSGKGHHFVNPDNVNLSFLQQLDNCVIQPVVQQHQSLNELYSKSVNTLRIATLLQDDGSIRLLYIFLRFGSGGARIDNIRAGGYMMFIDINGNVDSPVYMDNSMEVGKRHPDTGFKYSKLKVPSVAKAVQRCKKFHSKFPYTRFIAWDIYIDKKGIPGLIEWNAKSPDMWVVEALRGPLFMDNGIKNEQI